MGRASRRGHGRRFQGDRGTALLEAAIVLPFLALMVFGIVELGFLFRSATVVNNSTRSGARLVASQYGSATSTITQLSVMDNAALTVEKDLASRGGTDVPDELWIYRAGSNGYPEGKSNFSSCTDPCFIYRWNTTNNEFDRLSGAWVSPVVCGAVHDTVGVYVRLKHAPIGFTNFLGDLTVNEKTVMRLEPPNGDANTCPTGF